MFLAPAVCGMAFGQSSTLIDDRSFKALIDESSGEMGLVHFGKLLAFSGYAPSRGAEQIAEYLAEQARASGLSNVHIEKFPSSADSGRGGGRVRAGSSR